MATYYVCTDCAAALVQAGHARSTKPEHQEMGMRACDTHPDEHLPAATSVFELAPEIVVKLFEAPHAATEPAEDAPRIVLPDPVLPSSAGPLSTMAHELYVALVRHEAAFIDDKLAIERCIASARTLLLLTRGA